MSWKTSSVTEEKLRFVFEYQRDEQTMVDLCRRFGVSRETGYTWLRRYRLHGIAGLVELNRAPRRHTNQTGAEIEAAVLELREAHMRWGPRKLKRVLERDRPGRGWSATSTIGEIVKRAGLVIPRKKRRCSITHERIQAGHPEQSGRYERMHRTLKQDVPTARTGAASNASWIVSAMTSTTCARVRRFRCRRQQVCMNLRCGPIRYASPRSSIRTSTRPYLH